MRFGSCYFCNVRFKGKREFSFSTHIHPFLEGIQDTLLFRTDVKKVDYLKGKKGFKICLKPTKIALAQKLARARKSCNIFHIEEQYEFHFEYAGEVLNKAFIYNESKLKEMLEGFPNLFKDREEVMQTLFGNYIHSSKLHKRVLAKLTHDILDEVGIKLV